MGAFPPKAYLIGAQKAGTTTLAFLLGEHPDITLSNIKETDFLTANWARGREWYRGCFDRPFGKVLLDASPSYTMADRGPGAPESGNGGSPDCVPARLHRLRPDARFIYILRDPVERSYSAYWHRVRDGSEGRSFREAIEADSEYLKASDYAAQLNLYLDYFSLDRFLILTTRELKAEPAAVARRCFQHLGVAPEDIEVTASNSRRNRSFVYNWRGYLLQRLFNSREKMMRLGWAAKKFLPHRLHEPLRRIFISDIPPIADADRAYLNNLFEPGRKDLARLLNRPLDDL